MEQKKDYSRKVDFKVFLLLLMGIFLTSLHLTAQNQQKITVTGKVIEKATNEPIIGAGISIKGTTSGTMTDIDGTFELEAARGSVLVISYLGFRTQELPVAEQSSFTIAMDEDVEQLDEVVVIGYGQVRKGDATGSLTSIKPDELNKGIQVKAEDALIGKVAGVNIVPGSGAPGSSSTIRIRMGASLSATNDPLIVIDGVPVSNKSLNSINPNDIETFTVLKDASATAIYGSRASNGVVIVTTKKGITGATKPQITYNANFTASTVPDYYDVLGADEYRDVFDQYANAPATFQLGNASTNWQKKIFRTGYGMDHNLSISGAAKKMPYRVSVGFLDQDGTLEGNNYKRFNAGVGVSPKFLNDHLTVDINVKGTMERDEPASTGAIGSAISFDPTRPVHETYAGQMGLGYYMWLDGGVPITLAASNPVSDLRLPNKLDKTLQSIGNIAFNYKVHGLEDLQLNLNMGYDISKNTYEEKIPNYAPSMYTGNLYDGTGRKSDEKNRNKNYLINAYANYTKDLTEKHNINAMAGYEWQRFWYKNDIKVPTDLDGNPISTEVPRHDEQELYLLSFFGRLNYTFAQKLTLTATLRADASSRFAKDNRWGYFPSAALAYRLTEENFMKKINYLSDLKVRLSYGRTGQQAIGDYYVHLTDYTASYDNAQYQFGNRWVTMYRPNGSDPNIKWETTSTYNIGLDYGFLKNRIYGSIDVYTRDTKDLLNTIFVPAGSNFTNVVSTNIGNMESKGVELALNVIPVKTKDWEWTLSGNFSYGTSKITKLNTIDTEDNYVATGNAGGTGKYLQVYMVNETPNTFYLLKQAYDSDGKPLDGQYIAKDGSITTSESNAHKYVTDKSSRVPYYYGLSTRLNYKNWDLGINGHGSFGNYVYNYQQASQSLDDLFSSNKVSSNVSKQTIKDGFTQDRIYTDYYLESGSFFKVDNITLGYTFNKLWNESSSLRLAFSAQNVWTITNYSGVDPEIYSGIDKNTYQRPRIYTLSVNLKF
ncbi:TonB-dependent receptor [Dysgonomonas sp. 25]|uniref:SusC/RagA family TonB-linked outer membrane protein n=1 Tax=Dysgonomonas sp. 25 TaxID=2302933 RepID=UPI0013CF6102|nr:TonB-dependent receptor [Dysgonomonas sp. 25]NDV67873.1 TonB-dependent receptor [Dysgonomonas sp. 25]